MNQNLQTIPLNKIVFSPGNPRKKINDKSLKELAASIKENGVLQPIVVRPNGTGETFELIAGERRGRASLQIGFVTIPAIVRTGDGDGKILELQIAENLQRENVGYFEEAEALKRLREECDLDVSEIARKIGKSDAYVSFQLALCKMPPPVVEAMQNGWISKGVAWEISRLPNAEYQTKAAADLSRKARDKMVSLSRVKFYISETFGEKSRVRKNRNAIQKQNGSDYEANWKKYLVNFNAEQFESFKRIVRGKTDTKSLAAAIDWVMRKSEK